MNGQISLLLKVATLSAVLFPCAAIGYPNPPNQSGDPVSLGFTERELKEAARLVKKDKLEGSRESVKAPASALKLFPRLQLHFNSATKRLEENARQRLGAEGIEVVVATYEKDIDQREKFNIILEGIKQDAGKIRDHFTLLEDELRGQEAFYRDESEAFKETQDLLENEIEVAARDSRVDYLDVDWPAALPPDAAATLSDIVNRMVESYGDKRASEWLSLRRAYRRFKRTHDETYRQMRQEIGLRRRLLELDPARILFEIGIQIDECVKNNADANKRSQRGILITRGEIDIEGPSS